MPKIIQVMRDLGYSPTKEGVCFGIATMAAQAVIRKEPEIFYERITRIHNLTDKKIETIVKEKELGKTDDLFYFFDGLRVYHGLAQITEQVKKTSNLAIPRQSVDNKFLFKSLNDAIENKENQDEKFNFVDVKERLICSVTITDLCNLIMGLKSQLYNQAFSLMIHSSNKPHTVQLGFSNNNWLIANHDMVEIHEENVDVNNIIKNLLLEFKHENNFLLNAEIDILLSEQTDTDLSWVKKFELSSSQIIDLKKDKKRLVNLINSCAYANQHQMLEKIFRHIDIAAIANEIINNILPISMLLAELGDNHIETTNVLLKVIKDSDLEMWKCMGLLKGRAANGFDALFVAAKLGYTKTVNALLQAIEEMKLPGPLHMPLLAANKNSLSKSALYIAAERGHTEVVQAMLEAIQRARFDKAELFLLLEGKDRNGASILTIATEKGFMDITAALIQAIDNMGFSERDKVILLGNKNEKGIPILLAAFVEGRIEIVKYLIKYILSSNIRVDKKVELLQANVPSFNTSLYKVAKRSENINFVKYFEGTVRNSSQFTEMQKSEILNF